MKQTGRPKIAGILLIVSGSLGLVGVLIITFLVWAFSEGMAIGFGAPGNAPLWLIWIIGLIIAIPAVVAVIAGAGAIKRRRWGLAIAGCVCAMLYFNVLGIPALVLLILAKEEFNSERMGSKNNAQ